MHWWPNFSTPSTAATRGPTGMGETLLILGAFVAAGVAVLCLLTYQGGPHGDDDIPPEDFL